MKNLFSVLRHAVVTLLIALPSPLSAWAAEPVPLIDAQNPAAAWTFSNGQEFPGATGSFGVDESARRGNLPTLKLTGDFSKGGNYVSVTRPLPEDTDIKELSMWVRSPQNQRLTLRINDSTGQCHQIAFRLEKQDGWQKFVFPLERFFAKAEGLTGTPVAKYEYWGGANDGKWHGPAKTLAVNVDHPPDEPVAELWINDLYIQPKAAAPAGGEMTAESVRLGEITEGEHDWTFNQGWEFPGAKGSLTVVPDQPEKGKQCFRLTGDFTGGGTYVAMERKFTDTELSGDLTSVQLQAKSNGVKNLTVRLNDGTGQTHQRQGFAVVADGQWHDLTIKTSDIVGGEHWGGANDGRWHGQLTYLSFGIGPDSDPGSKTPEVYVADITASVRVAGVAQAATFADNFEAGDKSLAGWEKQGAVSVDASQPFKGSGCLLLARPVDQITSPVMAISPSFAASAGTWEIRGGAKSDLVSPDASYSGTLTLECLDGGGKSTGQLTVVDLFKLNNWQPISKKLELPAGTVSARFVAQINKASGKFWLDELSASRVAAAAGKDKRINRLVFSSGQVGNLLYPDKPRTFKVTVEADKPLPPEQLTARCVVRDYWGAEQIRPVDVKLTRVSGKVHNRFAYEGTLDLGAAALMPGRYYELHGTVERQDNEPFTNFTRFATVPEAVNNRYTPAEIPFLIRDWDDRIPEHCILANRMGIRTVTMWAHWNEKPPYSPEAPGAELCEKYGLGVLPGTVIGGVESGQIKPEAYPPEAMAAGLRAWLDEYGKRLNLVAISLGNEPPSGAAHAQANLPYYKAMYDAIKAYDPKLVALGTSNGPDESYFQTGFGKYLDVYDFHIYEDAENVALAMQKYPALFEKYGHPKPIWSTELGLNSQGVARRTVCIDMVKKIALFFANGGGKVCWFDNFYPDGDATIVGSSGEAQDMFDSRYNEFCPKLTAVCYYDLINSISVKKFVAQKKYGDDTHAYLFRDKDNHCLQILWKDKGRQDIGLPLPGASGVSLVRLDGSRDALDAAGRGVTLTVGEDPLLLLYDGSAPLAEALDKPALELVSAPAGLVRGTPSEVLVALNGANADQVELLGQPFWKITKAPATTSEGPGVRFTLEAPADTAARELDLAVTLGDAKGARTGEISLRPLVTGQFSAQLAPVPVTEQGPGVRLSIKNNGAQFQEVNWELSLPGQIVLKEGRYNSQAPVPSEAYFSEAARGSLTVPGGQTVSQVVPLAGTDPQTVYEVRSSLTDATGRVSILARNAAGFVGVPKVRGEIKLDGSLDEADWQRATVCDINEARQYAKFDPKFKDWGGVKDLSGKMRFLWDEQYLYVGVEVTDDLQGGLQQDDLLWRQDGLQFLIDPCRGLEESVGKYDYCVAIGKKGPQAWCSLTAEGGAPNGEAKDIRIAYRRGDEKTGNITYEIAIPWSRVAPFKPRPGGDLGLSMILNEDDGNGRQSYMTWFGDANSKQIDTVGDLILGN